MKANEPKNKYFVIKKMVGNLMINLLHFVKNEGKLGNDLNMGKCRDKKLEKFGKMRENGSDISVLYLCWKTLVEFGKGIKMSPIECIGINTNI